MTQLFVLPKPLNINANLQLVAGAKAFFYKTGTTVPQDTYQNAELTTPHANPVVADSAGVLPAIYLDDEDPDKTEYKLTLMTSTDALIYTADPINPFILTQALIGLRLFPRTNAEQVAGVTPTNYFHEEGVLFRYGAIGNGTTDDSTAFQRAISVGKAIIPKGFSFKIVAPATKTGTVEIRGYGPTSKLLCDSTVLTVTGGPDSIADNFAMENITAPWIITRDPTDWLAPDLITTLVQSNGDGYQPTVNDVDAVNDIWNNLTAGQQNQQIGPTIIFTGNAERIEVSRIYGRFVRIDMLDCRNSTVRDCNIRGGKGTWGAINFDNETNGGQTGINNRAIDNIVRFASYNGIIFQNNDRPVAIGNTTELCGESGIKPAGGGDRKCIRATVSDNVCSQNFYDGIDLVTSFPTNTTIPAYHKCTDNMCFQNGGNGINVDGRYSIVAGNVVQNNFRFGIWCVGAYTIINANIVLDNNQERNASQPEILGGGGVGCKITDNMIVSGGGQNSNAIYYDSAGYVANNYATGSVFFFGITPTSFLEDNRDDNSGLQHAQSFVFTIFNDAGTLKHALYSQSGALTLSTASVNRISGASATLTASPTGADASTAMAAGGKIGSAATNRFWLDTLDQVIAQAALMATVIYNDTATAVLVRPQLVSVDINGVTRTRLVLDFANATSGAAFALTTANIGASKQIQVQFSGRLS